MSHALQADCFGNLVSPLIHCQTCKETRLQVEQPHRSGLCCIGYVSDFPEEGVLITQVRATSLDRAGASTAGA